MTGTTTRHRALRTVIADSVVSSQGELVDLLADRGFDVTQATVSRDLRAVGAVKTRDGSGTLRYLLADDGAPVEDPWASLTRALAEYGESITVSGNLVVIKTPPGAAHVVAAAIDAVGITGTIGTVAGDDTMLIIADETTGGRAVARDLQRLGEIR